MLTVLLANLEDVAAFCDFLHKVRVEVVDTDGIAVRAQLPNAPSELREKFGWWVSRHEIDYKQRAFEGDEITAGVKNPSLARRACRREETSLARRANEQPPPHRPSRCSAS